MARYLDLEGLSIPNGGERSRDWEITYFVRPANHWFTARIVDGRAASAYVDG
jgi:hypothetical protein